MVKPFTSAGGHIIQTPFLISCDQSVTRLGSSTGPGAGPGVLPRVPTPGGRRVPHQPAVCAHGGRCRAPATVPSAEHVGGGWRRRGAVCERVVAGRWPRGGKRCPLWILSRWSRPRARGWWSVPRPRNQSGAPHTAAARSRVAAAACVTAAAVAHARTVSNPGLFVPTVNRGVEV